MAIDFSKYGKSIEEVEGKKKVDFSQYGTSATPEPVKPQDKGETGLKGFAVGVAKGALGTFKGMSQLGENIGQGILGGVKKLTGLPVTSDKVYSEEALQKGGALGKLLNEENLKGKSTAEKLGKVAEFVAEIVTPTTLVNSGIKALTATKTAIKALNPILTGNKLVNAYKEVVTAKRILSTFGRQSLSPKQDIILLGERLKDVITSLNPAKNLKSLAGELKTTETKLNTALEGSSDIVFNADKPTLINKLDGIKTQIPREFKTIKDNKKVFDDVVDFAKETLKNVKDTIKGLREGRSAFDAQAKLEYPNAFKEGAIDTSTPAGRAIKFVRDNWNNHLYDTAPNGSEIQQLIGRESDIFRATDAIAPKAAKFNELNKFQQFIKANPVKTKAIGGTVGAGIGYGLLNSIGKKIFNNQSNTSNSFDNINQ